MGDFAEQPPEIVFLDGHLKVVSDERNYTRKLSRQISLIGQGQMNSVPSITRVNSI